MGSPPSVNALLHSRAEVVSPLHDQFSLRGVAPKMIGWSPPPVVYQGSAPVLNFAESHLITQAEKPALRLFGDIFSKEKRFVSRAVSGRVFPWMVGIVLCGVALTVAYQFFNEKNRSRIYSDPLTLSKEVAIRDPAIGSVFSAIFPAYEKRSFEDRSPESNSSEGIKNEYYIFPSLSRKEESIGEPTLNSSLKFHFTDGAVVLPLHDQDTGPIEIFQDPVTGAIIRMSRENGRIHVTIGGIIALTHPFNEGLLKMIDQMYHGYLQRLAQEKSRKVREAHRITPTVEEIDKMRAERYRPLVERGTTAHFWVYRHHSPLPDRVRYGIFYPTTTSMGEGSYHLYIPLLRGEEGKELLAFASIVNLIFIHEVISAGILSTTQSQYPFSHISSTEFNWGALVKGEVLPFAQILPTVEGGIRELYSQTSVQEPSRISLEKALRISFVPHPGGIAERFSASALLRGLIARGKLTVIKPIK